MFFLSKTTGSFERDLCVCFVTQSFVMCVIVDFDRSRGRSCRFFRFCLLGSAGVIVGPNVTSGPPTPDFTELPIFLPLLLLLLLLPSVDDRFRNWLPRASVTTSSAFVQQNCKFVILTFVCIVLNLEKRDFGKTATG